MEETEVKSQVERNQVQSEFLNKSKETSTQEKNHTAKF